jgi:hypothetical protein
MTIEDFQRISKFFRYDYAKDSYFVELKDAQILNGRVELAHAMIDLVGRYYSNTWLRKNVLKQTDEDIEENDDQIAEESMNPQYNMAGEMGPSAGGILGDMALGGESGGPGSDKGGTAPGGQSPESGVKKATPGSPGKSNPKLKSLKNISQKLAS